MVIDITPHLLRPLHSRPPTTDRVFTLVRGHPQPRVYRVIDSGELLPWRVLSLGFSAACLLVLLALSLSAGGPVAVVLPRPSVVMTTVVV